MTFTEFSLVTEIAKKMFPWATYTHYRLRYLEKEYHKDMRVVDPNDISSRLRKETSPIRKFEAYIADGEPGSRSIKKSLLIEYRALATEPGDRVGLSFFSSEISKLEAFYFEEKLRAKFDLVGEKLPSPEMGKPCSILAFVVDMRGFTAFCENPRIESPYVSALLTGFYELLQRAVGRYPPDFTKYLGDGMLSLWNISQIDSSIAIKHGLNGLFSLFSDYKQFRKHPAFVHGAPEQLAAGVAYGLGSMMIGHSDYTGRPINLASRLCSSCPGNYVLIEKSCPDLPVGSGWEETNIALKSFGNQDIYKVGPFLG
jgi:class 3 adenylate cyclase